ncbi:HD domain-containing protein [Gordonia bronchialis]|uniref:HD family phosphohydrolase n=1 Tax=Gordonia bronchialis TaxID=2054 RepID=UPI00226F8F6E|nr:HD family phosphohydrolase [Gordonia bronchialis]
MRTDVVSEVETMLCSLRDVWDEESVNEYDHALQCGLRARADGADDELLLAAVLHDIGHSPLIDDRRHHERAAQDWLTARFGRRVGWLAGRHVAAKNYLAATEPGYVSELSGVSVDSLVAQGGPAAADAPTTHAWWPDAVRLRRYDDAAKVPGAPALTVEEVLEVARRLQDGVR